MNKIIQYINETLVSLDIPPLTKEERYILKESNKASKITSFSKEE